MLVRAGQSDRQGADVPRVSVGRPLYQRNVPVRLIELSELKTRERLLEIAYRLAELAEAVKISAVAKDHRP